MTDFAIRPAVEADCPVMLALLRELATFEKLLDAFRIDEAGLRRAGFGATPRFGCLLAERPGGSTQGGAASEVLGLALFFPIYSTFAGEAGLYVEDLVVRETARGQGIGKALLAACAAEAERQGCRRLMLSALAWNRPARALYESLGFRQPPDWTAYALAGESFEALARRGASDLKG